MGVSVLNFQREKKVKALLEITDLITFPICKTSLGTDRKSRIKIDQAGVSHYMEK